MKKIKYLMILFIASFIFLLTSCSNKNIVSYYLNNSGNLIAKYDNGETKDLGDFDESIIKSIYKISFSSDGYYVIDGIKTSIKVDFTKVEISDDGYYVIDGIKTSIKVDFTKVEISEDGYYVINGIKSNIVATNVYTVEFANCQPIDSQIIKEGYKVEKPQNPIKEGYTFNGWYCNDEIWSFNSDVVMNDMVLTANWSANKYKVSFINEKGTNPDDIIVTFDSTYNLPSVDSIEGYIFDGWYYNDKKVSSYKWNIAEDVVLKAKWIASVYTISLDAKEGNVSKNSVLVTYGENYTLPVPTNKYGVFNGWLYNDKPITDSFGNSLEPWTFTESITVSVDWIININTAEDLLKLNDYKNALFSLDADIDISGIEWVPVGTLESPFTGTIMGNNHKIKGLTITKYSNDNKNYGLIGTGHSFKIKDLILEEVNIKLGNIKSDIYVGAIVGMSSSSSIVLNENNGLIDNCIVTGSIEILPHTSDYSSYAGGISGYCSNVMNSTNKASVNSRTYAGGIIGYSGQVNNCKNEGYISATFAYGICESTALNCYNTGNIEGSYACGIVLEGTTEKCINYGDVTGTGYAGGISINSDNVKYCANLGNIESEGTAGGIVGNTSRYNSSCENCYNVGNVTGKEACGIGSGSAKNCYNVGKIKSINGRALGISFYMCKQCLSLGEIISSNTKSTYTISPNVGAQVNLFIVDCYYGQSANDAYVKTGTKTDLIYEKELYLDLLFWTEYNPETGEGCWIISETDFPKLWFEEELNNKK